MPAAMAKAVTIGSALFFVILYLNSFFDRNVHNTNFTATCVHEICDIYIGKFAEKTRAI